MKNSSNSDKIFDGIIIFIVLAFCVVTLYPLFYILSNSLSSPTEVFFGNVGIIPKQFTLKSFQMISKIDMLWRGYFNTIVNVVVGTAISLALTMMFAYPLSRRDFKSKKVMSIIAIVTMYFSGGMIPTFLLLQRINIYDTRWAVILPGCMSVWNVIVVRTYIANTIPRELEEASMIDGASDFKIFLRLILPLCRPVILVMILFYMVGYWNSYYNALVYLSSSNTKVLPLQIVLQRFLTEDVGWGGGDVDVLARKIEREGLKYAAIIISTLPILMIYPFLSRYLEKGLMMGSVKG